MFSIPRVTCVAPTGQAAVPSPFSVPLTSIPSTIFHALLTSGGAHAR